MTLDAKANLYGSTLQGGAFGSGTLFKLTPSSAGTWVFVGLNSFNQQQRGQNPVGALILDDNGNIYGTTMNGGNGGGGVAYEVTP